MSNLQYTPTFHHKFWIDNVDRVKAAGPDGFNLRFEEIDSDLQQVSTVVATLDTLLDAAGSAPPPGPQRLLVPLDPLQQKDLGDPWTCDDRGVMRPPGLNISAPSRLGRGVSILDLGLPDNATMTMMRIAGVFLSTTAHISVILGWDTLIRSNDTGLLTDFKLPDALAGPSPFDLVVPLDPAMSVVDNDHRRYSFFLDSETVSPRDDIRIESIELSYTLA